MKTTRVALVDEADDGTVGGSHRCLIDLARHLSARFVPIVVVRGNEDLCRALRSEGIEAESWRSRRSGAGKHEGTKPGRRVRQLAAASRAVRIRHEFLRRRRIEIVHLNNSPAGGFDDWLPAARLAGAACVSHARCAYSPPGTVVGRYLSRSFDRVIAVSRHIERGLLRAGFDPARVRQIYDGVDLEEFRKASSFDRDACRRELGLGPDEFAVLEVGHLREWKGQDILVEAAAILASRNARPLRVLFAGGIPETEVEFARRLKGLVEERGLGRVVKFLGHRSDVAALMVAADVVVHSSRVPEPFGLVVVEAMAAGRPVVASRHGGPAEIIAPGSGLLFDPERPKELAELLERVWTDEALRRALGEAAGRRAEAFDVRRCVAAIEGVYRELRSGSAE